MKTTIFSMIIILATTVTSFGQQTTSGFYINPNINFGSKAGFPRGGGLGLQITPQIAVGYLWGNKNRQRISINAMSGGWNRWYHTFGSEIQYNYDISLYRHKKLNVFLSPFAKGGFNLVKFNNVSNISNYPTTREARYMLMLGMSPQIEYGLGKHTDLVLSLPLNLLALSYGQFIQRTDSSRTVNNFSSSTIRPSFEANVGIRINLFNK